MIKFNGPRAQSSVKPFFRASVRSDGTLEIMVYDEIGESFWSYGITAKDIKQQLENAGSYSSISLRINSPGGDAFEGIAIGNLLKSTKKPISVCVDGIAASAASLIAMCGTTITMASNAMMMIHKAWSMCMGNADDMTKMADTLARVDGAIAQTYVDRTGLPADEIRDMMAAETWMGAADCLTKGFATAIAEEENEPAMNMARRFRSLARMQRLPETLKNSGDDLDECECDCPNCRSGGCESCSNSSCDDPNCEDCPMQKNRASASSRHPMLNNPIAKDPKKEPAAPQGSNLSLFRALQDCVDRGI